MQEYYIYLRKSRADSPLESVEEVLAKHELMLQELARKKLGYEIDEKYILREVVSGETISDRPKMIKLLQLIEQEDVKAVLVIEPQRLTRGDLEDCGRIVNVFRYTNTRIYTPNIDYDLSDKMQRKFFEQELMRGNDYLEYTKEILKRGKMLSAKKGNYMATKCPYGYRKITDKIGPTLEPDENAWVIPAIFDMYVNQNKGFSEIARYLDSIGISPGKSREWSRYSIRDILKNPHYTGVIRYGFHKKETVIEAGKIVKKAYIDRNLENVIIAKGRHEALVTQEIFDAASKKIARAPRRKKNTELINPFAGILYCKKCGNALIVKRPNGRKSRIECDTKKCEMKTMLFEPVAEKIYKTLLMTTLPEIEAQSNQENPEEKTIINAQIKKMEKELRELTDQEDRQYDLLEKGFYTEEKFKRRNSALKKQIEETSQKIDALKKSKLRKEDYEQAAIDLNIALEALNDENVSTEEKNRLLKAVVKRIELDYKKKEQRGVDIFDLYIDLLI